MSDILVIDTGSSGMRGILFDENGTMLHTAYVPVRMRTEGSASEYDPGEFKRGLIRVSVSCRTFLEESGRSLDALAFTSQRSSILPVDEAGVPLSFFMTWYDKRSAALSDEMNRRFKETIYRTAGMQASPVLSSPKILWLRQNRPELYRKAFKIIGIQDYLLFLCTGNFVTDATFGSRTGLMDVRTLSWSDELLSLYGIDKDKLADLLKPASLAGKVTAAFSRLTGIPEGTPVITSGGDQQCSVLGQGLFRDGDAGITCGSGAYTAAITSRPLFDKSMRVNLNASVVPGRWVLEASTLSSGTVQDWLNRTFFSGNDGPLSLEALQKAASLSGPGANGLIMLPDLAGKGCPDWDDFARGVFWNIGLETTAGDFARAMLEGLASEIAECCSVLRELLPLSDKLSLTGGLTRSEDFDRIIADMTGVPAVRCQNEETTAIGAFIAASCALSRYGSFEEACTVLCPPPEEETVFLPDPEKTALYRRIQNARRLLYTSIPSQELCRLLSDS